MDLLVLIRSRRLSISIVGTFAVPVTTISAFTFLGAWQREVTSFSQLHSFFSHHENALMFVTCTINKSKKANPSAEQCHMKLH